MRPKISVILPVYNGAKHLDQSISSILDQTFTDFEIIIINDGSSDKSSVIIDSYARKDKRIKVLEHKKNKGLIDSLNEGFDRAKGELIARQDADDVSKRTRFEKQVAYLDQNLDIGVLGSNYNIINKDGAVLDTTEVFTNPDDIKLAMVFSNQMGHGTIMLRRNIITKNPYDIRFKSAEDYELWTRLTHKTKIANLVEPLYDWRLHDKSVTTKDSAEMDTQRFRIRDREFNKFRTNKNAYRLFAFHPFSINGGLTKYLNKKNTLCRDMALLYAQIGYRRWSIVVLLVGIICTPWRRKTYCQLLITIFNRSKLATINYEYV